MTEKLTWSTVIKYRKQAAQILLNNGEITPLPSQCGLMTYNATDHKKIVDLAKKLREAEAMKSQNIDWRYEGDGESDDQTSEATK